MSAQLRAELDHARKMVDQCATTAARLDAEIRLAERMPDQPDPRGIANAREILERNRSNGRLWQRIADEIDQYLNRSVEDAAVASQALYDDEHTGQLDMFIETP